MTNSFKSISAFTIMISCVAVCASQNLSKSNREKVIEQKADSVLKLMTLDEKIGQMNQYNGDWEASLRTKKDGWQS